MTRGAVSVQELILRSEFSTQDALFHLQVKAAKTQEGISRRYLPENVAKLDQGSLNCQ